VIESAPIVADVALSVADLAKTYQTPFLRRRVEALRGVSFAVGRGEIYGFLGPNGAGKTTTIRILMGLICATGGQASILGHVLPSRQARARVGFLPEQPYFYDYLSVAELLDLVGRLFGLDRATRRKRADELIARVGLDRAKHTSLKRYSKGMMQRAGLAQALMNDPDVIILDEPMSGLDPVGRREVRELILEQRERGKTVFFSSHILSDVEAIADRVAIVARGRIAVQGAPSELVGGSVTSVDVVARVAESIDDGALAPVVAGLVRHRRRGGELLLTAPGGADLDELIARLQRAGGKLVSVTPHHETLEDLFMRQVEGQDAGAGGAGGAATGVGADHRGGGAA
jgi:ABC-2 type transport system ATP-binding protein